MPSKNEFSEELYEELIFMLTKKGKVKDLLRILKIEELLDSDSIVDVKIEDIKKNSDLETQLKDFIFSKVVVDEINRNIDKTYKYMLGYLKQFAVEKRFITVDIGYRGTIQQGLEKVLLKSDICNNNMHLLMLGTKECVYKIFNNTDLRSYVNWGDELEDSALYIKNNPNLIEAFLMCNQGTTIGYKKDREKFIPELENVIIGSEQWEKIKYVQEGMLEFQKYYLSLKNVKQNVNIIENKPEKLIKSVVRLISMPSVREAKVLSSLKYEENQGINLSKNIVPEEELSYIKEIGVSKWIQQYNTNDCYWCEGMIVQIEPSYYIDKVLDNNVSEYQKKILSIVKKVAAKKPNSVVVAGAGEVGKLIQRYLELYGIRIESFTDGNKKLIGSYINEVPVKTLNDEFNTKYYVIASLVFASEIKEQILEIKGEGVEIFSCLD